MAFASNGCSTDRVIGRQMSARSKSDRAVYWPGRCRTSAVADAVPSDEGGRRRSPGRARPALRAGGKPRLFQIRLLRIEPEPGRSPRWRDRIAVEREDVARLEASAMLVQPKPDRILMARSSGHGDVNDAAAENASPSSG